MPGFSHEYLNYMLGGFYRQSFRPLNEAIATGRIRGVAADVGCNNPGLTQDKAHMDVITELLKNDVLVVSTGCGALAAGKYGYLLRRGGPGQGRPRPARDLRDDRHPAGAAHGLLRGQQPHPHRPEPDGDRGRPGRRHQRHPGRGPGARVDEREGAGHRRLLRRLRRLRHHGRPQPGGVLRRR